MVRLISLSCLSACLLSCFSFAALPTFSLSERPNFVIFLSDDQTVYSFSRMAYLSSRPYGDWVEFDNAFLSTPLCCPSRASILTGKYAHTVNVPANNGKRFADSETLAVWLQRDGYQTSWIGKYLNGYPWNKGTYIPPGWSNWHAVTGNVQYTNYKLNENGVVVTYGKTTADYQTDVLNAKALQFLNNLESGPFMMVVSYYAPHLPIFPAPRHKSALVDTPVLSPNWNEADVSDKPAFIRARPLLSGQLSTINDFKKEQRAMMAVDESIQAILDLLSSKGWLDNTIVFFMTDNGFSRASHRWVNKLVVYEEAIRTPLWIRYPGSGGRTETRLVSNIDIAPTITELSGVTAAYAPHGMSLAPLLNNTGTSWRDALLIVLRSSIATVPPYFAIRTSNHKYVELDTGERELYDLLADPYELQNQADNPDYSGIRAELASRLQALKP